MDTNTTMPKASRETRRLLRWRQRARFRQHVRDAAMAILIVAGACLALALVSGLDLLFQVAPIAAPK